MYLNAVSADSIFIRPHGVVMLSTVHGVAQNLIGVGMSDLIRREDATKAVYDLCDKLADETLFIDAVIDTLENLPSAESERTGMMTTHEVACLLAELFDDPCACNYNGIDEWLPEKCELQDACPHPVGVACWEQFLKWRGER